MRANRPIRKIMTTNLVTVYPHTPMSEVKRLFDTNNFHHLLVIDKGSILKGIISSEGYYRLKCYYGQDEASFNHKKAIDVMKPNPLALDPEDTIGLAADIFLANQFHALPILEDDRLVGIITTHDLLKYMYGAVIGSGHEEVVD
ncbi:MAG: CBS domain-containing protein [Bacteroidota bacterium]